MVELNDAQRKWLQDIAALLGDGEQASGDNRALRFGSEYARSDSKNANVQLHEEREPPDNVNLPNATQGDPVVKMSVRGSGETFEMRRSQIVEESRYVDNAAQKMWAKPHDLISLEVKTMNFSSSAGQFTVDMDDIQYDMPLPAMRFEMRGKIVYPLDKNGDVMFDKVNTPNIVRFAQWVLNEIEQRRKIRRKITETTFMFQMALAQLGAAVGPPAVPRGPQPTPMKLPTPKTPRAPKAPKAPVVNNPAVAEAEVAAAYRRDPSSINYTMSSRAHNDVWTNLGNTGPAPVSFRVGDKIRVDVQRWPQNRLSDIGLKLRETPITTARPGGTGPRAPEVELINTGQAPAPVNPRAPTQPGGPPPPQSPPTPPPAAPRSGPGATNVTGPPQPPRPAGPRPPGPQGEPVSPQLAHRMAQEGRQVFASASSQAHAQGWAALGRNPPTPVAYIVDRQVYVDLSRWPPNLPPPATIAPRGGPKIPQR
jgi:hypothetical protein